MPIYTKKGDRGETGLPGKRRAPKTNQIFNVLGSFDQTSATIGLAVSHINKERSKLKNLIKVLEGVQSDLLYIGAHLASDSPQTDLSRLSKRVKSFEESIDGWELETGELNNFIIVGGSPAGAALHLSRTASREAERNFHQLDGSKPKEIAQYLNRLSDLLFQAARYVNYKLDTPEASWNNPQK